MRVLDVACGTGNLAIPATKAGSMWTHRDSELDPARLHRSDVYSHRDTHAAAVWRAIAGAVGDEACVRERLPDGMAHL
jgi:hypothetical protein